MANNEMSNHETDNNELDSAPAEAGGRKLPLPRWLIIVLAVIAVVLIGGYVTLKLMFPPDKLRAMVVPRIESAVDRDVELSGVSLRVIPRIAVRLDDLAIGNPPGFAPEPAVQLEALEVQVRLLPLLLRRQVEIDRLRLLYPVIRYEVLDDGTSNFTGIGAGDASAAAGSDAEGSEAPPRGSALGGLVVTDLTIRDGTVYYTDHASGRRARLSIGGQLSARPVEGGGGDALESGGRFELWDVRAVLPGFGEDTMPLPNVALDYRLLADLAGDSLALTRLEVALGDVTLSGQGTVRDLDGDRVLAFEASSGEFDIGELLASLPESARPVNAEASGTGRLTLDASGSLAAEGGPRVDGALTVSGLSASYGEYGQLVTGGEGTVAFNRDSLQVRDFTGDVWGRAMQLSVTVRDFASPSVSGHVAGGVDLERLAALRPQGAPLSGEAAFDVDFSGPLAQRERMRVSGPVRLSDVTYQSEKLAVPARIEQATVRLTGAGATAERIPILLGGSDLTVAFTGQGVIPYALSEDGGAAPPVVEFSIDSRRLDMSEIMTQEEDVPGYSDLLTARLAGKQVGGRDPADLARDRYPVPAIPPMTATGQVRIAEFLNPPTRARDIAFGVDLRDGVLRVRDLTGNLYGGNLTGVATLNLEEGRPPFALRYDLKLDGGQAGEFLERWTRLGSALTGKLDFSISGTASIDETLLPVPEQVEAAGITSLSDGRFQQFPVSRALANQLKLTPDAIGAFRSLGGGYRIEAGKFVLDAWNFAAGDLSGAVTGSAGLGGTLDLNLSMAVPLSRLQEAGLVQGTGPLGDLMKRLAGEDQAIQVGVGIGGTMTEPAVQIDRDALAKELEKLAGDAGKDLLKRIIRQ